MVVDLEVDNSTMAMVQVDLAAINAALTLPVHNNQPLSEAGCLWMANDWSCAFDAVFMALFSIYRRSSLLWQECWRAESMINEFLVEQFDRIFEAFSSDLDFFTLSTLFSECRDNFCDWMFAVNHQKFPWRGKQLAGVSDILEYFSDQHNSSMDLERTRLCSNPACPPAITTRNINHICHPSIIKKYWRIRDTVSIQSVVTQELSSILDQPLTSNAPAALDTTPNPPGAWPHSRGYGSKSSTTPTFYHHSLLPWISLVNPEHSCSQQSCILAEPISLPVGVTIRVYGGSIMASNEMVPQLPTESTVSLTFASVIGVGCLISFIHSNMMCEAPTCVPFIF